MRAMLLLGAAHGCECIDLVRIAAAS